MIVDDDTKATAFNQYFQSVFTVEKLSDLNSLQSSITTQPSVIDCISFTPDDVFQELANLDVSKACGPDLIPPLLLKKAASYICVPLSKLFTQSMSTGKLPQDWTTANVVPVFKKGDPRLTSNYRPISLTSIIVKVMERIIRCQIRSALSSNCRLNDCQHGFCPHRSTISLLLTVIHNWALCLEHRSTVHCLFLDYAKAFDSVPHERLLIKLNAIGVTGTLQKWLRGFLTNRLQRVVINGCYSEWLPVISGVPQGSVLGPLLFLLYINDLQEAVSYSELNVFADDVALYKEIKSSVDCDLLQEDLITFGQIAGNFALVHLSVRLSPSLTNVVQSPLLTL